MPIAFIKKIADIKSISINKAENKWQEAKKQADESGIPKDTDKYYGYITEVFKKMMGCKEGECEDKKENMIKRILKGESLKELFLGEGATEQKLQKEFRGIANNFNQLSDKTFYLTFDSNKKSEADKIIKKNKLSIVDKIVDKNLIIYWLV